MGPIVSRRVPATPAITALPTFIDCSCCRMMIPTAGETIEPNTMNERAGMKELVGSMPHFRKIMRQMMTAAAVVIEKPVKDISQATIMGTSFLEVNTSMPMRSDGDKNNMKSIQKKTTHVNRRQELRRTRPPSPCKVRRYNIYLVLVEPHPHLHRLPSVLSLEGIWLRG